jgi:O-antigen/teichoic acid export membrane protein
LIAIIIGRAAQFFLALAIMRVATTLLSPEEMGRVSLLVTTTAFFALFLINPIGMFINRRLHSWKTSGVARQYLIYYVNYLLIVALFTAAILYSLYMLGFINFGIPVSWLILLVCGSLVFNTINQTAIPSLNLLGDSGRFVLLSVATIATGFFSATLLVKLMHPTAQYWLLGLLLGQIVIGIVGVKIFFERLQTPVHSAKKSIQRQQKQALFNYAWPVAIAAGSVWVQGQGYRYVMEEKLGLAQLGIFVAGYSISAGLIAGFESVLAAYFQPRLYRDINTSHNENKTLAWKRYATAVIPAMILTIVFIIASAQELTRLFLGENFQLAAKYIVWAAIAEAARVLIGVYSLIAHVHMQTRWLIIPNLLGAVISISLCLFLIPFFGAIGVGIGLVMSGFSVVVVMHFLLAKKVQGGPPLRPIIKALIFSAVLWPTILLISLFTGDVVLVKLFTSGVAYLIFLYVLLKVAKKKYFFKI